MEGSEGDAVNGKDRQVKVKDELLAMLAVEAAFVAVTWLVMALCW